jgi:hypothetical protein
MIKYSNCNRRIATVQPHYTGENTLRKKPGIGSCSKCFLQLFLKDGKWSCVLLYLEFLRQNQLFSAHCNKTIQSCSRSNIVHSETLQSPVAGFFIYNMTNATLAIIQFACICPILRILQQFYRCNYQLFTWNFLLLNDIANHLTPSCASLFLHPCSPQLISCRFIHAITDK